MSLFPAFQKLCNRIIERAQIFPAEPGILLHLSPELLNRLAAVQSLRMVHSGLDIPVIGILAVIMPYKIQDIVRFNVFISIIHCFSPFLSLYFCLCCQCPKNRALCSKRPGLSRLSLLSKWWVHARLAFFSNAFEPGTVSHTDWHPAHCPFCTSLSLARYCVYATARAAQWASNSERMTCPVVFSFLDNCVFVSYWFLYSIVICFCSCFEARPHLMWVCGVCGVCFAHLL